MPLQTIEPKRLYRQIADQLRAAIDSHEFAPGARLPAERELALQLGVSRPSVREALIALEVEGVVEVRMGSGVYLRERRGPGTADPALQPIQAEPPLETLSARELIESELAARAARAMRPPQLARLHDALQLMEDAVQGRQSPAAGDRLFHLQIAEAVGNTVLARIVGQLFDERHNPLFTRLGNHFENSASWQQAIAEHRAVLAAIAAGDGDAARAAMSRHLKQSHDRFTAGWPVPAGPTPTESTR